MKNLSNYGTVLDKNAIDVKTVDEMQSISTKQQRKFAGSPVSILFLCKMTGFLHISCLVFSICVFAIFKSSVTDAYPLAVIAIGSIFGWFLVSLPKEIVNHPLKSMVKFLNSPETLKTSGYKSRFYLLLSFIILVINLFGAYLYCFKY